MYVMDGFGPSQIARKLRERKILTPSAYYESQGITCNVKNQGDLYNWDNTTIAGIMDRWSCLLYTSIHLENGRLEESYCRQDTEGRERLFNFFMMEGGGGNQTV